ncbi:hypothetical protein D3C84_1015500 [compost metagenome]
MTLSSHHTRAGWCHFRTNSDRAPTTIDESIRLFAGELLAAFGRIDFKRFEHRGAILFVAVSLHNLLPGIKNVVLNTFVSWVVVAGTFVWL